MEFGFAAAEVRFKHICKKATLSCTFSMAFLLDLRRVDDQVIDGFLFLSDEFRALYQHR